MQNVPVSPLPSRGELSHEKRDIPVGQKWSVSVSSVKSGDCLHAFVGATQPTFDKSDVYAS
jgi:hypothetical protein